MRYISTFSGIEAASVAWEGLGWEPICFSEIDEFPSAVLANRYPDVPNLGDITKIDWGKAVETYGRPDVLVGGSPCQSFSTAGGRESLDGESRLMFEYIRACSEVRSEWILWENVPGVLNTKDNAFAQLLDSLQDIGYLDLAWRVLDAQFFGVAQRRRRVFLVGHLGTGGGAAAVLFERESVRGNTKTSKQKREELARAAGRGSSSGGRAGSLNGWDVQSKRIFPEDGVAPTLSSGSGEGMTIQPSVLQSAGFCEYASSTARSIGYAEETAPTLKGNDWQAQVPDVLHATAIRTAQTGANGSGIQEESAHTVDTNGPEAVAYAVRMREGKAGGGKGPLVQTNLSGTIATGNNQTIIYSAYTQFGKEISGTLTARADSSPCFDRGQNVICMSSGIGNSGIGVNVTPTITAHAAKGDLFACLEDHKDMKTSDDMTVTIQDGTHWVLRRLTPTECERLQGFPDGWTDVPFRGKEHPNDTSRYKAIGNSMAVPVMRWIGERIQMADGILKSLEKGV